MKKMKKVIMTMIMDLIIQWDENTDYLQKLKN